MPDVFIADKKKKTKTFSHAPLASFCYYPPDVRFVTQDPEEKIILLLRQHPITNVGWLIIMLLMIGAPRLLAFFPILDFLPGNFQLVVRLMWYLMAIAFTFEKFLSWFFSVYIITDERVIDVDFLNLIYREITAADIDKIQDITVQSGGVAMSVFNYGNVFIQTASETPLLEFNKVPQPDRVAKILRKLMVEEEQEKIEGRVR